MSDFKYSAKRINKIIDESGCQKADMYGVYNDLKKLKPIIEKIYDEDIFYAMAHGYFDGYQLKKRIEPLLEAKNKSNNTQQLYYVNILAVLDWMKKRNNKS